MKTTVILYESTGNTYHQIWINNILESYKWSYIVNNNNNAVHSLFDLKV